MARKEVSDSLQSQKEAKSSIDAVRALEKDGGSVKVDHQEQVDKRVAVETTEQFDGKMKLRYTAPIATVIGVFILAVGALFFVSPMLVLINNKEQLVNDLNDSLYAHHIYSQRILGGQLGGSCDEETIACKFKTLSPMLQQRFESYGFTVDGEQGSHGRYNNATLRTPIGNKTIRDSSTLASARKNNSRIDTLIDRVYSSRNAMYQDRQFGERLLSRFGLEQDNTIGGLTQDEFKESFNERIAYGDQRYVDPEETPTTAPENRGVSQDTIDRDALGIYSLQSLKDMQSVWPSTIYPYLTSKASTHLSLGCALSTYANLMDNSLYRAKKVSAARFAMNYLAVADDLKARAGTTGMNVAVDYMANSLLQSNAAGENGMNARSYTIPALGEKARVTGELPLLGYVSHAVTAFAMRLGAFPLGDPLLMTLVETGAPGRGGYDLCARGMTGAQKSKEQSGRCHSPASVPLSMQVAPIAGVAITAAKREVELLCILSVEGVVEFVKLAILPEVIARTSVAQSVAVTMEARKFTADTVGQDAQNIIFAGAGTLLGDRAQSLGMKPANVVSFTEYYAAARTAQKELEQVERQLAKNTPWDVTNPYSFLGSIASSVAPSSANLSQSWLEGIAVAMRALPASMNIAFESSAHAFYTQPMHFQMTRLSPINSTACGVGADVSMDIMLDIGCNTRYSMSRDELALEIDEILEYMSQPHPENAQASQSEITGRDFGAAQSEGDRMKREAQEGLNAAYIDETGKPNKYTEYAKFLQFCTNRQDQWGYVGMVVEEQDEVYVEDILVNGVRESHGKSLLRTKPEDAPEPESYYGYGWGSKADQEWYTGKKCVEDSEMLKYFRGYTMACSVLAGMSGARQCWHDDTIPSYHQDDFYTTNNILFKSAG